MTEEKTAQNHERYKTIVALLMALVTIIGAVVAWRAALANDEAGDTNFLAWHAAINAEEAQTVNNAALYQHYSSYTAYVRYGYLGDLIEEDREDATPAEAADLERQQAEAWDVATTIQEFFPLSSLNRDGTYNLQRELGEAWADASKDKDLNPERHYAKADRARDKATQLISILTVMGVSLWLYALAEGMKHAFRYVVVLLATVTMIGAVIATLIVELR